MGHLDEQTQQTLPGIEQATEAAIQSAGPGEGVYNGARLFSQNPQLYETVVRVFSLTDSVRATARLCGVHVKTVMGVRDREGLSIATERERLSRLCAEVSGLTLEIVRERLSEDKPDVGLRDLLVGFGISVDKMLLLAGQATARIEHVLRTPDHDDFNRIVETTGWETETPQQKDRPAGLLGAGSVPAEADPAGRQAQESPDRRAQPCE